MKFMLTFSWKPDGKARDEGIARFKKYGLQDRKNRRMINSDDALKGVFAGKRQVSMFDMTKLVSKHLKG